MGNYFCKSTHPNKYSVSGVFRKLRDEYDRLEGALKKLGVDPDCSNTEVYHKHPPGKDFFLREKLILSERYSYVSDY